MNLALGISLAASACYAVLAVVVVARRGLRTRVHQLFFVYLLMMLVWQVAYTMVSLSRSASQALPWYQAVIAAAAAQGTLVFLLARALLRVREKRIVTVAATLVWCATVLALLLDRGHLIADIRRDEISGLLVPDYGPAVAPTIAPSFVLLCMGILTLVQAYRHAPHDLERNRLRYLLLAIVISLLGGLANLVPALIGFPVDVTANIICALLLSYAILRYQLLDITLVVRRGLAYSILTAAIALVYLFSLFVFERIPRATLGGWAFAIPIALAMLAALLLRPWREKAQAWIDRLFFRDKYDAARMLRELSRRTATVIDLETLGDMLLSEICHTMHLARAALFLREASTGEFFMKAQLGLSDVTALRLRKDHPIVQWLRLSEQPLHAHELDTLPQFRSLWTEEKQALDHLDAQLFIPLLVKDGLIGILAVGARLSGDAISSDDEMTLVTLANQTAVAVENAHLFATTKARVAELTALQEIGVRLVSSHSLPSLIQVVVQSAISLLAADGAYVALYDPRQDLWIREGRTAGGEARVLDWGSAEGLVMQAVAQSGQAAVVDDLRLHPTVPLSLARESHFRACAAWPLRRGESTTGVLAVLYDQPHPFSEEELRLLGMLSDNASLAIDNALLLESEQSKRQLADTLCRISGIVGSSIELDVVLERVLEQLQNVVHYDSALIMLLSNGRLEVSNALGFPAQRGLISSTLDPSHFPFMERLLQQREPVIIGDILAEAPHVTLPKGLQARAFVAVPLVARDQICGILAMGKAEVDYYDQDDARNAVAFANQAAIAIENARLYREMIEEKRRSDTILRETQSGIIVTGVDLRITTFNAGAEAITGYTAEQVIGRRLPEVLGAQIVAPGSPLAQVMATGQRVPPQETVLATANGERDILQGAVALHGDDHNPFGYLVSLADITRLKEVDRLKSDIVANVSHELRTPLASIKAYTELLLNNIEGDDQALRDEFLHVIDRETDRLAQLIGDLLNLSRLEAGRFEVRSEPIRLDNLVGDVLTMLEVQRRTQEVTIRVDAPDGLPVLEADREMLTMVIKNLVGNAIKFSRRGEEVSLVLRAEPDAAVLQIIDRGIGIPADAIPHLFQKFYRVPVATDAGIEGTGLGLVLAKQAVQAHGGSIMVESELGVGSTFTVRLPWKQAGVKS
jgi:PAS domain S-box-containing protein